MTKKFFFLALSFSLILIFSVFLYVQFNKKTELNIETKPIAYSLDANLLVTDFITDENNTNEIYAGKVIEITGKIKEISYQNDRNTVILFGDKNYGIICDFDTNQTKKIKALTKNEIITVKGICKGFLKDVILLNCLLMTNQTNE